MIKVLNCNNKNYINKLITFLNLRRSGKKIDTKIVAKIIQDIKKNKLKAVLKYEKKRFLFRGNQFFSRMAPTISIQRNLL